MQQATVQVKFKYLQTVKKETQKMEKIVKLRSNIHLHKQWDNVVQQLNLKKCMKDYSINFLYPMKYTPQKAFGYLEFTPEEGDEIVLMNPVGAKKSETKKKRCGVF